MWVYQQSEPGLWTVGFYSPDGQWHSVEDFGREREARSLVNYLNGGSVVYSGGNP